MLRLIALCLSLLASPVAAQITRVEPVDEAARDSDFAAYRTSFIAAVAARDIPAMLRLTSPDVELSFGGHSGHADFVQFLTVPPETLSPEYRHEAALMRAEYWKALEDVLTGGGVFTERDEFIAPYTWAADLPEIFTPYETYFLRNADVPMHRRANGLSKIITRLNHEALLVEWDAREGRFWKVTRGDGQTGYVRADLLWPQVGYRAIFRRGGGRWQMVMFLAGD